MKKILLLIGLLCLCTNLRAQEPVWEPVHIWDGTPVRGAHAVTLTPYLPEADHYGLPAFIVCPGGSYFWLDVEHEGVMVAEWLRDQGYAAFLLQYRTGGWFDFVFRSRATFGGGNQHPDMIADLQRSIQLVRENWQNLGIDPRMVGAMGFSAGGHLVMSAAELYGTDFLAPLGIETTVSLRPDFVAPIYPVVTMEQECVHKRSRRGLLGERRERNTVLRDSLSLEKHVRPDGPPVFLLNCVDDPIVDYRNSNLLDSALIANKVPHFFVQYKIGGHGFGADPQRFSDETRQWQATFLQWFKELLKSKRKNNEE